MKIKLNLNILKDVFVILLTFFFVYDCYFLHFNNTTNEIYSYIGVVLFALYMLKNIKLYKADVKCFVFFGISVFWAVFVLFINGTEDWSFIKNELIRYVIGPFFASFLLAYVLKKQVTSMRKLLDIFIIVSSIQCCIILVCFFVPEIKTIILSIQTISEREVNILNVGIRSLGLGTRFDFGAFNMSFILIFTVYLYLSSENSKKRVFYVGIYFLQAVSGLLLARSILIGIFFSALLLMIVNKEIVKKLYFFCEVLSLAILIVCIIVFLFPDILVKHASTFDWMFQYFMKGSTSVGVDSLDVLFNKMYFFPNSIKTWIIGDGMFSDANGYAYMNTDPLYMRYLLYWGIPGIICILCFLISIVKGLKLQYRNSFLNLQEKNYRLYFMFLNVFLAQNLIVYLKINSHFYKFLFLFGWFIWFHRKKGVKNIEYS